MTNIELVTFAKNNTTAKLAIDAGATHLVLEDSKVCIRSYSEDFNQHDFSKLAEIAQFIRGYAPNVRISANCDLIFHERHLERLLLFISSVKSAGISTIRIQDAGLIPLIKEHYPEATIHLNPEIGNHNQLACQFYAGFVQRQILSNELCYDEIKYITSSIPSEFEVHVQGPILIQYSNRRYLSGLTEKDAEHDIIESYPSIIRTAQDQDYKKRLYRFYDNAHGHMMFLYFDRCLIRYIPDLMTSGCIAWLIDGRGESEDYLKTALETYAQEKKKYLENPTTYTPSKEAFSAIQHVGQRPQKAGFFRANMTDQHRKSYNITPPEDTTYSGKIVDLKKEGFVTFECESPITVGDQFIYSNPKGESIAYTLTHMKAMDHTPITQSESYSIVLIKWQKGMASKSKLYKYTHK